MKRLEKWIGNFEAFWARHDGIIAGCGYLVLVLFASFVVFGVFFGAA